MVVTGLHQFEGFHPGLLLTIGSTWAKRMRCGSITEGVVGWVWQHQAGAGCVLMCLDNVPGRQGGTRD